MWKRWVFAVQLWIVGVLVVAWATQAADTAPHYPDSEPGRHARAWFEAYNAGESAMRAYLQEHVAPAALANRSMEERLEIYRTMRDEHGSLTPLRVTGADAASATVTVRAELGPPLSIRFQCDPEAPHGFFGLLVQEAGDDDIAGGPPRAGNAEGGTAGRAAGGAGDPGHENREPPISDDELAREVGATIDSLAGASAFSGTVLLTRGDRVLLERACGLADRASKRPNDMKTKFNLGSINKAFTHVAILQLAEQGKIRLTDPIDRYLPDYPKEKGSKITVAMLLDHRGGTGDIFRPGFREKRLGLRTSADWYRYVRDLPLDFEPGTKRAYSNAGYVLLGAIVESASGLDYYRYVRERIFQPAGMKETDSYAATERVADRAVGYTTKKEGDPDETREVSSSVAKKPAPRPNDAFLPARGSAAGGGYSTAGDLVRFIEAMRRGALLDAENSERFVAEDGAFGIAGGSPGVNAALETAGPYTLAVLANLDPPAAERVAAKARRLLRRAEGTHRSGGPGRPAEDDPLAKPASTHVPAHGVDVPMTLAAHLPRVEVMVNGKGPFHFAIDTGGSGTARVDSAFAAALGLPVVGEAWGGDPSGRNRKRMDVVSLDSISIGGARFAGLRATTRSSNELGRPDGVDGILGFGLFTGTTVTFDYPGGRLRIDPTELPPADGKRILTYRDDDGIPSIRIQVDTLDMVAHVDAGSMGGFILPERMMSKLPLASAPVVIGTARTVSNTFEIKGAPLRGTLRIGDLEFDDPRLEFQPIMPDANVGSRVLKDYRVSFDTRNKRIRFVRAS